MDRLREKISLLHEKEDFDIMVELSSENNLSEFLSCQPLEFQLRADILKLIVKACSCHSNRQMNIEFIKRLVLLKAPFISFVCIFLSTIESQKIGSEAVVLPLKLIFEVVLSIFQCLPVSSVNFIDIILPQLQLILKKLPGKEKNELISDVHELLQERKDVLSQENNSHDERQNEMKEPPPPCDFRDIDLLPNKKEIESQVRPYVRANIVKGPYENVDHYLDVQFRLMREDMFRYLRESIAEYKSENWPRGTSALLQNGHIYFDAQIISKIYSNGIFFIADVYIGKKVDWSTTKRLLSNSLLCISSDGFQTFTFAYVRSFSPAPRKGDLSCKLKFSLADEDYKEYIQLGKVYDIIETTSFYESYRYVLERLQLFSDNNFPLSSSILFFKDCDRKPEYWKQLLLLDFEGHRTEERRFQEMISSRNTQFDEYQHQAFQMALSNQVSMIQGPPGTGKTYLGLQIVKWLVQNVSLHMGSPILVICYTNHALDQFLEGILNFTQKVVRIGGQCKNMALERYHINNIANVLLIRVPEDEDEYEFLSEDEMKSRSIGEAILGFSGRLNRVGKYTYHLKQTEKELQNLQDSIIQLENNPLYNETIMLKLLPKNLREELLGWLDSSNRVKTLRKYLVRSMEKWLCISESYLYVYEDLPELLYEFVQEFLRYIKHSGYLNADVTQNKFSEYPHGVTSSENKFLLALWKLFLKTGNLDPVVTFNISPRDADNYVKCFLSTCALDKIRVFKFLEKASEKCLEQRNCGSELELKHMWSNGLLERWEMFLNWKSEVRRQLEWEISFLKNGYINSVKEREEVRFQNNVEIAKRADILGLTTTGAAKHWKLLEQVGARVVVAEEAAEVLEAHITTALNKFTKHLILIGDHKQLRPIPSVYELARRFKLDISMFERLIANGAPSRCLQTQHRMRPCIAKLLVPEIYESLENHPSVQDFEDIKGMATNMYFLKHNVHEDGSSDLRSHRNKHEADFIVSLCHYLLQQGHHEDSITILTTYAGQVNLIRELVNRKCRNQVRVTTVDNFQGEENNIILLSFVRSNERNSLGFLEISNRICVALSRARKGLFCIGNFDSFAQKCDIWRKITRKLKEMRLISSALPLKCQNHPTKITFVSRASNFDKVSNGGCTEKCIYRLACGHTCSLHCHITTTGHDEMVCSNKCQQQYQKKSRGAVRLRQTSGDEYSVVELPQSSDESMDDCFEYDYESDDYESDHSARSTTEHDLRISRVVPFQGGKEPCPEDSLLHVQGNRAGCRALANDKDSELEELQVLSSFSEDSKAECVRSENYADVACVTKTSNVSLPLVNEGDLSSEVKNKIMPKEHLFNSVEELKGINYENESFAKKSVSSNVLSSEISETEISVTPGDKSDGNNYKKDQTEHVCTNGMLYDKKSPNVKGDGSFAFCESVVEMCVAEMLSDTRFRTNSDNLRCKDEELPLQEQMLQKNKLLEIMRSQGEEKVCSSGEHDVSPYVLAVRSERPEVISEACDHLRNKKSQCGALIVKKLPCQHDINIPCNKYSFKYDCNVVVDVELPCLHLFSVTCKDWMWLKEIHCTVSMSLLMPCGKLVRFLCSEGPYHADCVATVLKCGHKVPCYTDLDTHRCEVLLKCNLPCSHEIYVPCILYYYSKRLAAIYEAESETGNKQTSLQKLCEKSCNFIMECGHRCLGKCGVCSYDRKHYTCLETVKRVLPCGHQIECECHAKDILCLERCDSLLECDHRCSGQCGSCMASSEHQSCNVLVTRYLPCGHCIKCECHVKNPQCSEKCNFLMDCGHRCTGMCETCKRAEEHHVCWELVKTDLPCGHQIQHVCHVRDPSCNAKCAAVLSCGHYCPGRCCECFNLQIHAMCSELMKRQLPCGHYIEWPCGSPLPVCNKRCLFGCEHNRCINSCLDPCSKCLKPCDWKCEHLACSMLCSEPCDRPACDVRCTKILACGHQCCGYCDEPCPKLCVLCDKDSFLDKHGGSNWFVLLENCQHAILMEDLKTYFTEKSKDSCPRCPECGTVVTKNRRFGDYIKSWISSNQHAPKLGNHRYMASKENYILDTFLSQMIEKNINLAFIPSVMKTSHSMYVLKQTSDCFCESNSLRLKGKIESLEKCRLKGKIESLEKWLSDNGADCSEQQVEESCRAVWHLCALLFLQDFTVCESECSNSYLPELRALLERQPFGESEEKKFIEVLQQSSVKDKIEKSYFGDVLPHDQFLD